jgi:hypothetical protein
MAQPEKLVQLAIIKWLRAVMPKAIIHHSRNEHQKAGLAGLRAAQSGKTAGVLSGFPDLIVLPTAEIGPFFLEVKAEKGTVSSVQKQVHEMLRGNGYPVAVVRSIEDVRAFLAASGIKTNEVTPC